MWLMRSPVGTRYSSNILFGPGLFQLERVTSQFRWEGLQRHQHAGLRPALRVTACGFGEITSASGHERRGV